jgi:hypothetical protein
MRILAAGSVRVRPAELLRCGLPVVPQLGKNTTLFSLYRFGAGAHWLLQRQ